MCSASVVKPNIFLFFLATIDVVVPICQGVSLGSSCCSEAERPIENPVLRSVCLHCYAIIPLLQKIPSLNKSLTFLESIVFVFWVLRNILESNVDCSRTKLSKDIRRRQAKDLVWTLLVLHEHIFNLKSLTQRFQR